MKIFVVSVVIFAVLITKTTNGAFYGHILPGDIKWNGDILIGEDFRVKWYNGDDEFITMEMSAPTKGYVAVGFSSNGGMDGSDIVMGWMDSEGTPHLLDMHGVGNMVPLTDPKNDYELLWAEESDGRTTIIFRRRWETCDTAHDLEITDATMRLIWAFGKEDPKLTRDNEFAPGYHTPRFRGTKSVIMKGGFQQIEFPDNKNGDYIHDYHTHHFRGVKSASIMKVYPKKSLSHWDAKLDNVTIGEDETSYYCKILKAPVLDRKHQIIGYRPLIDERNKQLVHHINFFECLAPSHLNSDDIFEQYINHPGEVCYNHNMPLEWGLHCMTVPFVWVVGSDGLMLPPHVGIPLKEEHGGATYFMMEIHYNNPENLFIQDSSGIRMFLTDKVRQYDAGTFTIHSTFGQFQLIPPHTKNVRNFALCTTECTNKVLPPEGIAVTHATLHGHLTARKMIIRHIRDGNELFPLAQDLHYDFNYQQTRLAKPGTKILPGDVIMVECEYDSSERDYPTYGGTRTVDEMCQGYVHYYPRVNLSVCKTQPEFHNFFNALGISEVEGDYALQQMQLPYQPKFNQTLDPPDDAYVLKNTKYLEPKYPFDLLYVVEPNRKSKRHITVREVIDKIDWDSPQKKDAILKQWWDGPQYTFCTGHSFSRVPLQDYVVSYPTFKPYEHVSTKCFTKSSGSSLYFNYVLPLIIYCNFILLY